MTSSFRCAHQAQHNSRPGVPATRVTERLRGLLTDNGSSSHQFTNIGTLRTKIQAAASMFRKCSRGFAGRYRGQSRTANMMAAKPIGSTIPDAFVFSAGEVIEMKRRKLITVLGAAAALMAMIGSLAWVQWEKADRAESLARREVKTGDINLQQRLTVPSVAVAEFARMRRNVSRFLADLAHQHQLRGDVGTALLLALESLQGGVGSTPRVSGQLTVAVDGRMDGIDRVYAPESELQLDSAWRALRERHILVGHEYAVNGAAISPDGKRVVTASTDKTVRLWHTETGEPIGMPLVDHADRVTGAAFSPDGSRIVTTSADRTARLWDAASGRQIVTLTGHTDVVNSAAFSSDSTRIVTASRDETVRLWDAATGQSVGLLSGRALGNVRTAAFSPDGKRIVTASTDKTARLWDAETREPIGEPLIGHTDRVTSASFSADGKLILTASWDKTARLW